MNILQRNSRVFVVSQFFHSLIFTIPIWIVYYQGFLDEIQISFLVAYQFVMQVVMELPSGALADLIGRKKTNALGFTLGALSFLLFPIATEYWHFMGLATLVGFMDAFRSGSEEALLYDSAVEVGQPEAFKPAWSRGNVVYQAGLIISTFLGGFMFGLNQHLPYLAYGVSLFVGIFIVLLAKEPKIDSERFSFRNYINQLKQGTKEAFKNKLTTNISLFYIFAGGIAWTSTLYFNDFMMVDFGFGNEERGVISSIIRLINAVLIVKVVSDNKWFTKQRTVLLFPIIMLLAYLPGFVLDGIWGVPFVQLAMAATTARWLLLSPLANEAFQSKYRATAISVLSLLLSILYIIITGSSGIIITKFGVGVMYSLLGVLTLFTVVPVGINLVRLYNKNED